MSEMDAAVDAHLLRSWSEVAGLRDPSAWDEVRTGGRRRPGPVVALVCPLCAAWVPLGERDPGFTYRDTHVEWHEMGHQKRVHR